MDFTDEKTKRKGIFRDLHSLIWKITLKIMGNHWTAFGQPKSCNQHKHRVINPNLVNKASSKSNLYFGDHLCYCLVCGLDVLGVDAENHGWLIVTSSCLKSSGNTSHLTMTFWCNGDIGRTMTESEANSHLVSQWFPASKAWLLPSKQQSKVLEFLKPEAEDRP